jgi:hypothetical protein
VNPLAQLSERQYKQNMTEALAQLALAADWVGDAAFYGELLKAFGKHLGSRAKWEEMQYDYTGSAERLSGCV